MGGGGEMIFDFPEWRVAGWRGATLHPNIYNNFFIGH